VFGYIIFHLSAVLQSHYVCADVATWTVKMGSLKSSLPSIMDIEL